MSEGAKHTPGPWELRRDRREGLGLYESYPVGYWNQVVHEEAGREILICEVFQLNTLLKHPNHATGKANLALIAAAPDMLAALKGNGRDPSTPDFLDWLADRLVNVYGESSRIDFVHGLRQRAAFMRAAIAKAQRRKGGRK